MTDQEEQDNDLSASKLLDVALLIVIITVLVFAFAILWP